MPIQISAFDYIIAVILIIGIFIYANNVQQRCIERFAYYKYFTLGLAAKIFFSLIFAYIYLFFYGGGDTVYYYRGADSIVKAAYIHDFWGGLKIALGYRSPELYSLFNWQTGYPTYYRDVNSFAVCRFIIPFYLMGFGSFFGTTVMMNAFLYIPIWNFYRMLCSKYPGMSKEIAIAALFFPSMVFWSSGILKDVWCLAGLFVMYRSTWLIFIKRRNRFKNLLLIILWSYILISIRPFVFYTSFVTVALWIGLIYIKQIDNKLLRVFVFPFIMITVSLVISVAITSLGGVAEGKYATIDSMLEHAVIIQDDLSRTEAYGENTFNIGSFDASIPSMLSKGPVAVTAGLFRPFLWEARSLLMIFSGLESTFFIIFFVMIVYKSSFVKFFKILYDDNYLFSTFVFAVLFAFFCGLTVANFGALVRYKITMLPFFAFVLFRVNYVIEKNKDRIDHSLF